MKKIISLLFVLMVSRAIAQNYIAYHNTFNSIDNDILTQNKNLALQRLDSIYLHYPFIYAGHCIKALQICVSTGDSVRAGQWLQKCFVQGVPLWIIRNNILTKPALFYQNTRLTLQEYQRLRAGYTSRINQKLATRIDSLLKIDQRLTKKVNTAFFMTRFTIHLWRWRKNNKKEFAIINQIIDQYGFRVKD